MELNQDQVKQIIQEIGEDSEQTRRAYAKRRHDMYLDGGRKFLLETLHREFGADGIKELRLCPINVLKKIINKKSSVYSRPPMRLATGATSNQALVDYYTDELSINETMQKCNRYYNLLSNTVLYAFPSGNEIKLKVIPSYLYGIVPNKVDPSIIDGYVFNNFVEESILFTESDIQSATGVDGFRRDTGYKNRGDMLASEEKDMDQSRQYIFWTETQHFTTDDSGNKIIYDKTLGDAQFVNPIQMMPVINVAKDRDAEPWARQGEDLVDIAMALQLGWTDLLSISKIQGFAILTIISPEEPKQLTVGINRAVWLKQQDGQPNPSISYVSGNSPLDQYKANLMDLLGLLLTTNDMAPGSVSGNTSAKNFSSGFQALIEMSDTIQALEEDKPVMRNAEKELWEVIAAWHNHMYDIGVLEDEAKSLGRFSDDFEIAIHFPDMKPIESEQEKINAVKSLLDMGLITQKDALKKMNPDLTDEQIDQKLEEIKQEKQDRANQAMSVFGNDQTQKGVQDESIQEEASKKSEEVNNMGQGDTTQMSGDMMNGQD